ncbi:MAG: RNA polymerase sigma factor [Myxococcota bacterium]
MQAGVLSISYPARPAPAPAVRVRGARMEDLDPLIDRARRGDEAAYRELFECHRGTVARVVQRFVGASPDLEDIVQDVFVHVFRSIRSFRGESKFTTWLYRLTANVTKMHLRRGNSRPRTVDLPVPEASPPHLEPAELPDSAVARDRRVRALHRLLDQLSEKKRTVLVLHDLEGLPAREIADIVGAPVMTVRTRLFYARKALYEALAAEPALSEVMEPLLDDLPGKPGAQEARDGPDAAPVSKARQP